MEFFMAGLISNNFLRQYTLIPRCVQFILLITALISSSGFIVIRDDVEDEAYLRSGEKYSDIICHFPMGEGTLIDSCWVLTAGHVGKDLQKDLSNGLLATAIIDGKEYEIEKVIVHPEFEPIVNDVSLVKLKSNTHGRRFVRINSEKDENGREIILVGRGDVGTGITGPQQWDKKTRAGTNRIDGADEKWLWFRFDEPGSKNVTSLECISGPGDSGGPALVEKDGILYLLGISSNQRNNGLERGTYGVMEYYTRVSSYQEWLIETMHQNSTR